MRLAETFRKQIAADVERLKLSKEIGHKGGPLSDEDVRRVAEYLRDIAGESTGEPARPGRAAPR